MKRLIAILFAISGPWIVAAVFVFSALETALVLGMVLPGELVVVLGGVLADLKRAPLPAILVASILGPLTGDVTGYFLGRRFGREFVRRRLGRARWERAHRWLSDREGGFAIFLGRFLPFLRTSFRSLQAR